MPKYVFINGSSETWRIPDTTDITVLSRTLEDAMRGGEVIQVPVFLSNDPAAPVTLLVNGRTVGTVGLAETDSRGAS